MQISKHKWVLLILITVGVAGGGYAFWRYTLIHPSTSDAYTTAHVVHVEPQIGGRVLSVPVTDNQAVSKGQTLLEIDPQPYRIALEQAQAELALAKQQKLAADAQAAAAEATVGQRQAQLDNARRTYGRDRTLLDKHVVSQAQADADHDAQRSAAAALKAAEAGYQQAVRMQGEAEARIGVAQAALDQATLNLSYTTLVAPADGRLGRIAVRPGDVVQDGEQLFPLVEDRTFWVEANYKETDVERIRPGQPATVSVDMYPDKTFRGVVDSVSPASGVAFSLLPPENATGNWVKVTQRFPVRVRITTQDASTPLRIGTSSSVTIDTSPQAPAASVSSDRQSRTGG